jgi:hypothetical protein
MSAVAEAEISKTIEGDIVSHEPLTREDIRSVVDELLDARNRIDSATHVEHHRFIEEEIERRKRRRDLIERVKQQVIGWGVIALLGAIGTAVYSWVTHFSDR